MAHGVSDEARDLDVFVARGVRANRGDLASQSGIVHGLCRDPHVRSVHVSTHYPRHYESMPGVASLRPPALRGMWSNLPEIRFLRQTRPLVIWGGGIDLQDSASRVKIPLILLRLALLKAAGGNPVIQAFQGAGPISHPVSRACVRRIGNILDRSVLREPTAVAELSSVGVPREKLSLACDGALLLPPPTAEFGARYLRAKGLDPDRAIVGVNLRRWFHQRSGWLPTEFYRRGRRREMTPQMMRMTRNVASALNRLAVDGVRQFAMIPMYREFPEFWEDDIFLLGEVEKQLDPGVQTATVGEDLSPQELTSVFSGLSLMIGVRLHSTILAHVAGVPAVHIAYEHKGAEHFEKMGMETCLVGIDRVCSPEGDRALIDCVSQVMRARDAVRIRVEERVDRLRADAQSHLAEAVAFARRSRASTR